MFTSDPACGSERVDLRTLADVLGAELPDIVKCNAEGAEYELVRQLGELPVRPAFLCIEAHPEFGDVDDLRRSAEALGYQVDVLGDAHRPVLHLWRGEVCAPQRSAAVP